MERSLGVRVESEGFDTFTGDIDGAIGSLMNFQNVVGLAGAALAAFSAGALAKSIDVAASFQEQMVEVEKVTNPETADAMGESIRRMAREMPVAINQLTDIAATAGRLGVRGEENISRFTEAVAKIGVATDLQASEAATNFAKIANALNTPIEEVENMGSSVNALSNNVAASTSSIVEAMRRAAPAAGTLGVKFDDLAGITATLVASGMQARRAGTRMNRAFQELASNSGKAAEQVGLTQGQFERIMNSNPRKALMLVVESLSEIDSKTERLSVAKDIFGSGASKAINTLATNFDDLNKNLEQSGEQYEKATSLQEEYDTAASTFNARLRVMQNRFKTLGIQIGSVLLPVLTDLINGFNFILGVLIDFNEKTDDLAGAITLIGGVIGGTATTVAWFASQLGFAASTTSALGTALSVLTGPVGIAIAAIAALAAAFATDFMGIRTTTINVLTDVKNFIEETLTAIWKTIFAPIVSRIEKVWNRHGDELMAEAEETWNHIKSVVDDATGVLIAIVKAFAAPFVAVWKGLVSTVETLWNTFGDELEVVANAFADGILGIIEFMIDGVISSIRIILALIRGDFQEALDIAVGFWQRQLRGLVEYVTEWAPKLKAAAKSAVNDAMALMEDLWSGMVSTAESKWDDLTDAASNALNGVVSTVNGIRSDFETALQSAIEDPIGSAKGVIAGVDDTARRAFDAAVGEVEDVIDRMQSIANVDVDFPSIPDWLDTLLSDTSIDVGIDFPSFSWSRYIDSLYWTSFVDDLAWWSYVDNLSWSSWLNDLDWSDWLGNTWDFAWTDWLGNTWEFDWDDWIPDVEWGDFVPDLDWDDFINDLTGLATGGVVSSPTPAVVGEAGPEAVVPLDKSPMVVGPQGIGQVASGGGGGGTKIVVEKIEASSRAEGKAAARGLTDELRSAGFR